jgi:hypothetical protein
MACALRQRKEQVLRVLQSQEAGLGSQHTVPLLGSRLAFGRIHKVVVGARYDGSWAHQRKQMIR